MADVQAVLADSSPPRRVAFAAASAQRLYPGFASQPFERSEDRAVLERTLGNLWSFANGDDQRAVAVLKLRLAEFPEIVAEGEAEASAFYGECAVTQVMYALEAADGDPEASLHVVKRAAMTMDALDEDLETDSAYLDMEVREQVADLTLLRSAAPLVSRDLDLMRERAIRAGSIVGEAILRLRQE